MRDDGMLALQPKAPAAPARPSLEVFGRALLNLLECRRCFVFSFSPETGLVSQAVRVGFTYDASPPPELMNTLARRPEWQAGTLLSLDPTDVPVTELLGRKQEEPSHALAGRLPADGGEEILFIVGWRATPFSGTENACFSRAARVIWATMQGVKHRSTGDLDPGKLVEELAVPAFTVDPNWRVQEMNEPGRQLLLAGNPLRLDHGVLVGPNAFVNNVMQQALRHTAASRSERVWASTLIPLSTEHRSFAFAWIGAAPTAQRQLDRLLVIIPKLDAAAGAKRIASTFGLPWAEERIVHLLLRGEPPGCIGRQLDLTESTVRTYIKRIMLKIGINRQLEFFLLYILTQSPFGDEHRCHGMTGEIERLEALPQNGEDLYEAVN